jgi:hypothetical protein
VTGAGEHLGELGWWQFRRDEELETLGYHRRQVIPGACRPSAGSGVGREQERRVAGP